MTGCSSFLEVRHPHWTPGVLLHLGPKTMKAIMRVRQS